MKANDYIGIFIWGTGYNANKLNSIYKNEIKNENIIGYIDNNPQKCGELFWEKPVYSPDVLNKYNNVAIYISVEKKEEVYQQICAQYPFYKEKVLEIDYFKKKKLMTRYEGSEDSEIKEIMKYLHEHQLQVFNYAFVEKYKAEEIFIGMENDLYYTDYHGKKLFFSKDYDTEQKVRQYYLSLLIEQDENSPHRYLTDSFKVPDGAVVIDAGTAEGMFSLDIIDKVKKIYMFEPEKNWVDALKYTFGEYMDKVVIINQCVSNYVSEGTTTIDHSVTEDKVDFIKIDIEGEEYYALQGAEKLLKRSHNVKCDICAYHQEFAYEAIKHKLEEIGFLTMHSKGWMWYPEYSNITRPSVLRRGLIRAEKA